jgi:hypothetical protein
MSDRWFAASPANSVPEWMATPRLILNLAPLQLVLAGLFFQVRKPETGSRQAVRCQCCNCSGVFGPAHCAGDAASRPPRHSSGESPVEAELTAWDSWAVARAFAISLPLLTTVHPFICPCLKLYANTDAVLRRADAGHGANEKPGRRRVG